MIELKRGINLGDHFEDESILSEDFKDPMQDWYYPLIKDLGFDHVRIPVRWTSHYNKNYTIYGSIFTSALGGVNPNYQNTILYGHHMNDGRMFAAIMNYNDLDFYKSAPIINFDTIYEPGKWKVISMFKTNTLEEQGERFDYLKLSFANTDDFLEFVYQIRVRSLLDIPVDIKDDDKLLTLSTCSYEMDDFRTVVVARKIRDGESEDIDLQKAKLSENPLMPEGWYKKYGGEAPKVTNFKNALANGEISWYVDSK